MLSPYLANGELKPLPMGLQVFEGIISTGVNYIDKTEYIYRMTRPSNKFVFLSRPRRFGKSMLCYTLRAYFEGKRELFRDLAIDKLETEWQSHPVILLSMNTRWRN